MTTSFHILVSLLPICVLLVYQRGLSLHSLCLKHRSQEALPQMADNINLHAIVDMGSNGIRYSVTDLSSPAARLLPTVYQSRSAISIYDAQFSGGPGTRVPIPEKTMSKIVSDLQFFFKTCQSFKVPAENTRILATEATRTAPNSAELQEQIKARTGFSVNLLAKEDEGLIGALGILSSFPAPLKGLFLDLGGGSVQISWVMLALDGKMQRSTSAISMPFGAAAIMDRLKSGEKADTLAANIESAFGSALRELDLPNELFDADHNVALFLSGGGFRGWGHALMDQHFAQPYPIPIINGFKVEGYTFDSVHETSRSITDEMFRISTRRASQAPAVALLIKSLLEVLPKVSTVHFAQGGVREGYLFSHLPASIQAENPLLIATQPYMPPGAEIMAEIVQKAIPQSSSHHLPAYISQDYSQKAFTKALANLLHHHASCPKDIRPSAALRSTTTGILAATHGLTHESRAWLALALFARWDATREDLPATDTQFYNGLSALIGAEAAWWAGYIGRAAAVVGTAFPAGFHTESNHRWAWSTIWDHSGKKTVVALTLDMEVENEDVRKALQKMIKWGKKKRWNDRLVQGYKVVITGLDDDGDSG